MAIKLNRWWRAVLVVVALLVAMRLALPWFVTRHVNKVLNELEGYRGSIHDVDIELYRGAYKIDSIRIFKIDGNKEIPFIDIPLTDLSVEWEALFNGALVGEVNFHSPVLNFISEKKSGGGGQDEKANEQTGKDVDWTEPIKKLMPFDINRLSIHDGKLAFHDLSTDPKVDIFLRDVEMDALNLNNAKDNPEELPSRVYLQAISLGNGQLNLAMRINVLKEVPDLDMDLRFENVNMTALNDFFQAYAHVDVESGSFNLYSEVAVADGEITGYVKPLLNGLHVVDLKEDSDKPAQLLWESMVGFVTEIFENQKEDQFATRVPVEGQITEVNSPFWPALWGIFSNAFVEAFDRNTDGTVTLGTVAIAKHKESASAEEKSKKELRKEHRKEKRDERRKARKERKDREANEKASRKSEKDNS
jgi:hypothetical protein